MLNKYFPPDFDPAKYVAPIPLSPSCQSFVPHRLDGSRPQTSCRSPDTAVGWAHPARRLPKGKRPDNNMMKVRMMLPMSIRCQTCGTYMYKGTKFNTRKEDVEGENYLGIQVRAHALYCTPFPYHPTSLLFGAVCLPHLVPGFRGLGGPQPWLNIHARGVAAQQ